MPSYMPLLITIIFVATYSGLAIGRLPGTRTDRAAVAVLGAVLVALSGALSYAQAIAAIDGETLVLLFAMMVIVGALRLGGVLEHLTEHIAASVKGPRTFLALVIAVTGVLSAFLVNDVVCLALAPLVARLCRQRGFAPTPFLIALALASNIGSTATTTGNPQNMIIATASHFSYLGFLRALGPVAVIGLGVEYVFMLIVCRKQLAATHTPEYAPVNLANTEPPSQNEYLFSSIIAGGVVVAFLSGIPAWLAALAGAGLIFLGRRPSSRIFAQVNWELLAMFIGLFVVVGAFDIYVLPGLGLEHLSLWQKFPVVGLSVVVGVLSNVVSNVPAILLFKPLVPHLSASLQGTAWLTLAMASTLAGNLTLLGSVANLIVVESAKRERIDISYWDYLRLGMPVALLTMLIGILWLR